MITTSCSLPVKKTTDHNLNLLHITLFFIIVHNSHVFYFHRTPSTDDGKKPEKIEPISPCSNKETPSLENGFLVQVDQTL